MGILSTFFTVGPDNDADAAAAGLMPVVGPDPAALVGTAPVQAAPTAPPPVRRTAMEYSVDEILVASGVEQGRNSAETVILMRAKLLAFPAEAQLAMVRAMDAGDDTWDEEHVVADAQKRVAALAKYTTLVGADETNRVNQIAANFADAKSTLDGNIADIDAQIKQLQASRETATQEIAAAQKAADTQTQAVHAQADGVRQTVVTATEKYKGLLQFFGK